MPITTAEQRAMARFGEVLQATRRQAGLVQEAVAKKLRTKQDRISYIERGRGWPTKAELTSMLQMYGVNETTQVLLQRMVEEGKSAGATPWDDYLPYMSKALAELVDLESAAVRIFNAASSSVPGLLQTRAYTEALFAYGARELGTRQTEALVEVRQLRQKEAFQRANPMQFHAVLTEGVARTEVGGRDVLREQLDHLLAISGERYIKLQILHYGAGAAAAVSSNFSILDFAGAKPHIVSSDVRAGIEFDEKKSEVQMAKKTFEYLSGEALSPADSVELLKDIRKGM